MTPLQIKILLHYWACGDDFRGGDFSAPAVRDAIDHFDSLGLIVRGEKVGYTANRAALEPYVRALEAVPLPVQQWVIPPVKPEYGTFDIEAFERLRASGRSRT